MLGARFRRLRRLRRLRREGLRAFPIKILRSAPRSWSVKTVFARRLPQNDSDLPDAVRLRIRIRAARANDADCGSNPVIYRLRTSRCLGRRIPLGRRVRAGGLCDFPAANSFAPAGGRHGTGSDTQPACFAATNTRNPPLRIGRAGGDEASRARPGLAIEAPCGSRGFCLSSSPGGCRLSGCGIRAPRSRTVAHPAGEPVNRVSG